MNHRISFHTIGTPNVLRWEEAPLPEPRPGEAKVRHRAIGVNYIDAYQRSGAYPVPLPAYPGFEAVGRVEALGSDTAGLQVGQRVGYVDGGAGAYSEAKNHPASRLIPLPETISDDEAAGLLFKGLTAHMLVRRVWRPQPGAWALVHAAAGGVGLVLTRWLTSEGVRVIGLVSTDEKAALAKAEGAEATLVVHRGDSYSALPNQVRQLTGRAGAAVVFDSTGRDTFESSLDSLAPFGLLVSYGRSSGPLPTFDPAELAKRGSLALQRPSIFHHVADHAILQSAAKEMFAAHAEGKLKAHIHRRLPLQEAAEAHALFESRATTGALILLP
ncbi:quinone oxidoreductase [Geothrix sp. PMB-07]|uniref:quinone oxidoreductase family protein n=1 Tax=Geothrix sp. PMB-07 TaxID=3068640 RepID=UPI0027406634|nr:quinone oxidoreductase [Geothrix sp. PMB-07]WLT31518.1 quinone oxidoreductase [Geothrix sp. PMB-07]